MWMWISLAALALMLLSLVYLIGRVGKFGFVRKLSKGKKLWRRLIAAGLVVVLSSLLVLTLNTVNAVVILLHLTCIWLICDGVGALINRVRGRRLDCYIAGWAALLVTSAYLCCGWYLAHHVIEAGYLLATEKDVEPLRLVLLSDSHVGADFDAAGFSAYIDQIDALAPHAVAIVGDFVDDDTSREDMLGACAALSKLSPVYGVYFAWGNHDWGYYSAEERGWSAEELVLALEQSGVRILADEAVELCEGYMLIGREDRSRPRLDIRELVAGLDPDDYQIVLDHQPNDYDAEAEAGVDLVLSGHTHGGQFIPIIHSGEWTGVNDATYGLRRQGDTDFIVTSGIGCWSLKFRTGCQAEYVCIDIEGK